MNKFTEKQREAIRRLAKSHFDVLTPAASWEFPEEHRKMLRDRYAYDILKGLTDPDVWGQ